MPFPILLAIALQIQNLSLPAVPPTYTAQGTGVQIYRCNDQSGTYAWVFQSPEATLTDAKTQRPVGTHAAGPTWTWADGSSITGKVRQTTPSNDPASIPWLLLEATRTGTATGALTPITLVYRSDTHGGKAPSTGCDPAHKDATIRVPYTATYTFYKP